MEVTEIQLSTTSNMMYKDGVTISTKKSSKEEGGFSRKQQDWHPGTSGWKYDD